MMPSWGPTLSKVIPDIWFENVDFLFIEYKRVLIGDSSNKFPEKRLDFFLVIREHKILEIQFDLPDQEGY